MPSRKFQEETLRYEEKLFRRIMAQERAILSMYDDMIREVSPWLSRFNSPSRPGNIWIRNKAAELKIQQSLEKLQGRLQNYLLSESSTAWNLAADKTDGFLKDYIKNLSISEAVKDGLFARDLQAFEAFQKRKVNGLNLSQRVWKGVSQMKTQMEFYLESGMAAGRSAVGITRDVKLMLKEPDKLFRRVRDPETGKLKPSRPMAAYHPGQGVYRSSFKNALRTTRTETNMAYRMSDITRWRKTDFILGYEVKLSGSHPEFDICDHMAGRYPKTFTFGGWHPNCYCYMVPVMMNQDQFVGYLKSGKVPESLKVKNIPPSGVQFVKKISPNLKKNTAKPYWLENFTLKQGKYVPKQVISKPPTLEGVIKKRQS